MDCLKKALRTLPIVSKPRVVVVSDTPSMVKDIALTLEGFAEVISRGLVLLSSRSDFLMLLKKDILYIKIFLICILIKITSFLLKFRESDRVLIPLSHLGFGSSGFTLRL